MPNEVLLQILSQKLYFDLLLIILAHGIVSFIIINFGVYILTKKILLIKTLPFIALGVLCTLFGRTVFPNMLFGFVGLTIICIAIKVLTKATMLEALIISITTYMILGISTFIIHEPLFALYPNLIDFLMKTSLGVIVGSLFETVLPLLLLFAIHALQLQPKLFIRKKITLLDIAGIFLMLDLFYLFYNTSFSIIKDYASHQVSSLNIISQWACAIAGILAFYIFLMYTRKDYDKQMHEKEELKKQLQDLIAQNNTVIIEAVKNITNQEAAASVTDSNVNLAENEVNVLKLLIDGKSNKEISASLNINTGTVRNIISKLLDKFDLDDRTQLAIYALKNLKL